MAPTITLEGVGKSYSGTSVLRGVSLSIVPGEIHALLGENGAGKSTLLKILGGVISADEGTVRFGGREVRVGSPREAIDLGVSLIAQELALVPQRTVLENIFLGRWDNVAGFSRDGADRSAAAWIIDELGFDLCLDDLVSTLSLGQAQQLEIVKALARGSKVLCLDEPTAALGEQDTQNLLKVLRRLASQGTTVIIVSHFLDEALGLADRMTVLRDGEHITTDTTQGYTPRDVVALMVGREVGSLSASPDPVPTDAAVVLDVEHLSNTRITSITLQVRAGEIVGLAGLMGSGRSETLMAIAGADRSSAGRISVSGTPLKRSSLRAAMRAGVALIPESRKEQGLVLGRGVGDNVALPSLRRRQVFGWIQRGRERETVSTAITSVDIRGRVEHVSVGELSGGNQQKVLFAKWLVEAPRVLLIDEPTRGVDIAAKANIHHLIIELARRGTAVIVASSDLEEVLSLSHRLLVLRQGAVAAEFGRGAPANDVMTAAFL
ncbi:sugar ABC transporter ATP-binding protein [Galactobacter valiniphilus]|uniref:Sugar ABC transporter ATP-binding protein n=1 Tax=Galactobacter valiniphilus TaxID=2676122 RepID=A0A399JE17_9MICC|nr:sugar ABC transporter ATP-binding protein [Galactobacter valiniphilus]RII42807.1 sugar ABC transporter ATP-binding protein [Galactobacter valiniphilus]